jgi:hypothetical protein
MGHDFSSITRLWRRSRPYASTALVFKSSLFLRRFLVPLIPAIIFSRIKGSAHRALLASRFLARVAGSRREALNFGWVYVGALGGPIYDRVPRFLGLDPVEYSYDACSKDAAAVNSEKGRELDRRLREYCAAHTALEVDTALNEAKIGCARVYNTRDQYEDAHYAAREMTVPVLDRQSGVPIRVYGVVPKMSLTPGRIWRGAPSIGDDTTDILARMLGLSEGAIDKLYGDGVVHRTEPFTEPQVAAVNP